MADENTVGIQELVKQLWDVAASAYQDSLPQGTNAASSSSANAMQSFLGARGVDPALSRELIDSVARALVQVASPTNINLEQAPFYQELTGILGRLPADSPAFGQPRQDGPAPNAGPGNSPPGNTPPGNTPPGNTPPGNSAPGNTPPGNSAPGNSPLGNSPSSNSALGNTPPGNTLPGITPPANSPPGTTPTGTTGLGNTGPGNPPAAPGPLSESTATTAERI
ncbi:MAG: hypothetical protein K9K38_21965, partial [Rhodoferax sp.]|nr:hypothetical protein [Rhodoferax sp.]